MLRKVSTTHILVCSTKCVRKSNYKKLKDLNITWQSESNCKLQLKIKTAHKKIITFGKSVV
jgi:hypothetical protein